LLVPTRMATAVMVVTVITACHGGHVGHVGFGSGSEAPARGPKDVEIQHRFGS
jgi:hypothetical protein